MRHLPNKDTAISGGRDEPSAIFGKAQAGGELAVSKHCGHTLRAVIVVHVERLVCTTRSYQDSAGVQGHLRTQSNKQQLCSLVNISISSAGLLGYM